MTSELSTRKRPRSSTTLNRILELELAGLVRYLHYSFMIFGHNRIPIVAWLRSQADESQAHAVQAGEHITNLGRPSVVEDRRRCWKPTSTTSTRSCARR